MLLLNIVTKINDKYFGHAQIALTKSMMPQTCQQEYCLSLLIAVSKMCDKLNSNGLGGILGVSQTLGLGVRKSLTHKKIHLLLLLLLFSFYTGNNTYIFDCMSLIMALQRSNELYKTVRYPFKRYKPTQSTLNCISVLLFSNFALWLLALLLTCGDIQQVPAPDSVESLSDSSTLSSNSSFEYFSNHLSIKHLNIQSLLPKMDMIKAEAHAYDVFLRAGYNLVQNNSISIEKFMPPHRTDRCDRAGGGAIVYVRDSFSCRRRHDLEIRGLEAVWAEILVKSKKILIVRFYCPPNSNDEYLNMISESVDRAHNTNIAAIIITGDFNFNMNSNNNKMVELIRQYNLKQKLINEPTHFTESTTSLIDLIVVRKKSNILTSGVIGCFLPNQTRYHCPVLVLLKFLRPSITAQYWYY